MTSATAAPATQVQGQAPEPPAEDRRTQRRGLAAMWAGPGGAVAAMVAVSWYIAVRNGGAPPGGDMVVHAAAAEWFRTQPWWDWRGWSDWFYGGQAMGVNYPPLSHIWMRFTHPVYGQLAAVTVGLLVLLPWGVLRLARAVGYTPPAQRAAVGTAFSLVAVAGTMYWFLPGFHYFTTFFGSWPAMLATTLSLFCAAWAARCQRPVLCGVIAGVALLWNATVMPGVAVLCAALVISSGASFRQGLRWSATAACSAAAVCAWWLVPFVAGWSRLVRWEEALLESWTFGGIYQVVLLAVLMTAAAWAARHRAGPARRLALAIAAVLAATLAADLFGYLRPERWLVAATLILAVVVAQVLVPGSARVAVRPARPAWALVAVAVLVVMLVISVRLEFVPLMAWVIWWPRRTWAALGAVAWSGVFLFVPLWPPALDATTERLQALENIVAEGSDPDVAGTVLVSRTYVTSRGGLERCPLGMPWRAAVDSGGRIRPLFGLYAETSSAAEFVVANEFLEAGYFSGRRPTRRHWGDAWDIAGKPYLNTPSAGGALGARWHVACSADGPNVVELPGTLASGVLVQPHGDDGGWHSAAVRWWLPIAAAPHGSVDPSPKFATSGVVVDEPLLRVPSVPILATGEMGAYPVDQPASGAVLHADGDTLTVRAERAGWAWLRVPWDPWWHAESDIPVHKGGPGHLVVWAPEGETTLRWAVPRGIDVAAATVTGVAVLGATALAVLNRRRGFHLDPHRPKPAAQAVELFADTVDQWAHAAARRVRRAVRVLATPLRR